MSSITQPEALTLVDQTIQTDYQLASSAEVTSTVGVTETADLTQRIWHTALTGADLESASVTTDEVGQYEVAIVFHFGRWRQICRVYWQSHQ